MLRDVLSKCAYQHFLSLSISVSIMLDANDEKRNAYLQYARDLLNHFVNGCDAIYGETFVVYNVHSLQHLPDDVYFFQSSLTDISCFPFEHYMQQLKRLVRNGQNPLVQVVKRLEEVKKSCPERDADKVNIGYSTITSKLKDSCFQICIHCGKARQESCVRRHIRATYRELFYNTRIQNFSALFM